MTIQEFAARIEREQTGRLIREGMRPEYVAKFAATHIHVGRKYTRVDVGDSGKYMVDNATGEIFGIKGYGVIHRGHRYGTLETAERWNWSGYTAWKIA